MRCGRKNPRAIKKFFTETRDGKWLNAEQAIDFGLINKIWSYKK
jgi:ATP-dependent protease ClpP protease subunit